MPRQPGLGVLTTGDRLAVWGDPIAHSRSPQLHAAAYRVLGLDWRYSRLRVDVAGFADALAGLDGRWRGLSLTMPLKSIAHRTAVTHDRHAQLTGAVNTLLLDSGGPRGFNTDVGGIVAALAESGIDAVTSARIIGAGATATSALVALAEMGARRIEIVARRPDAVEPLTVLGEALGVRVLGVPFDAAARTPVPVTVATLPGDAAVPEADGIRLARNGGVLLDVVYGHWPTPLAELWQSEGGAALSGLGMLLHQAVRQVRIFTSGEAETPLPEEAAVLSAMRSAAEGPLAASSDPDDVGD
ncbi:shikimate dehydrogenase [Microbacterium aurantiacum]|uniref:shikimate dehydrogenase n=1 Tax=Microbacterium aurantiacum TaxID=162393 RepID=UPI0031E20CFD